jgi:hypothetical protein
MNVENDCPQLGNFYQRQQTAYTDTLRYESSGTRVLHASSAKTKKGTPE